MVEEVSRQHQWKGIEDVQGETNSRNFETRVRYMASSLIVTIPVKVARELGIKLGDSVLIQVQKKEEVNPSATP